MLAGISHCVSADDYSTLYVLPAEVSQPVEEIALADISSFTFSEVFTLSGQKVASGNKADALRQLPKGIYVVKDGHNVVKVTKR